MSAAAGHARFGEAVTQLGILKHTAAAVGVVNDRDAFKGITNPIQQGSRS